MLVGLDYALVDPQFVAQGARAVGGEVANVLVSFGQRDSNNATGVALDALTLQGGGKGFSVTVALGRSAPHVSAVKDRVAGMHGVALEVDADMNRCYSKADLVIGGGGVGLLERMAQGLPSVTVTLADNQRGQITLCAGAGGTIDGGFAGDLVAENLASIMLPLLRAFRPMPL